MKIAGFIFFPQTDEKYVKLLIKHKDSVAYKEVELCK